jgi:hypothetical protein
VIDDYLEGEDWDEPPEAMAFAKAYGDILAEATSLVTSLREGGGSASDKARAAQRLFVFVPAFVNVILNYKICVEHGLPLHPTVYYELTEARCYRIDHSLATIERGNRLYRGSIDLARSAYRLDADFADRVAAFESNLPDEVLRFVYTGGQDKYSWRGAEPARLRLLAKKVRYAGEDGAFVPALLIAAAHGAIMPALLLAEYLDLPLYFVRFSMFKRNDEAPIVSVADEVWLSSWKDESALLYDEDVAKGTTLELFTRRISPLFAQTRSACTIRHAGSTFIPDFIARVWWD